MEFKPIILEGFEGREAALSQIKRYVHYITPIMFYRTNDLIHSRRVLWHLEEAIPNILSIYKGNFDIEFARTLALVHDDVEIITGDVQLFDKENMKNEELKALVKKESNAIPEIVKMYNEVANGFDYAKLLVDAKGKNSLEAQFVSFFDKFDASGEAWHEIWAGNNNFLQPAIGYIKRLNEFLSKYPALKKFFKQFPEYLPKPFNFKSVAAKGKPHTKSTLQKDSGYPLYERWKKTIINREGTGLLIKQIEFSG